MSMYYTYYLGYLNDDKEIVPLGPFDNEGNLRDIFFYSYHKITELHESFMRMPPNKFSKKLKEVFLKKHGLEDSDELWSYWGYMDLNEFIAGVTSHQKLIRSGYWKSDELLEFLNLSEDEQADALSYEDFPEPIKPEVFAVVVQNDPDVAKKYSFYSILDSYGDDHYRYLAHAISKVLIDEWEHEDRQYVIFYDYT